MNSEELNEKTTADNVTVADAPEVTGEPVAETENAVEQAESAGQSVQPETTETPAEVQAAAAEATPEEASAGVNDSSTPPNLNVEQTQEQALAPAQAAEPTAEEAQAKNSRPQNNWKEHMDKVYNVLMAKKENNETIEVEVKSRIRGGLRVIFDEVPLFLPASHFSLKRTPTEQELQDSIGQKFVVNIHELQEFEEGRKAIIVSRKQLLLDEFWTSISEGDIVEGRVSSVASFGVFVDLGGVEGLIHISRLSQVHISDPATLFKKGDKVQAVVVELERNKNRIALSRKELEESPWKNVETEYEPGTQHKGIVRRLTEFGAYVELKPGVDGLLRTAEISWTKRIRKPSDVFQPGQEIMVEILSVSSEKQTVSLSYKKTQPNPWEHMSAQFPVDAEFTGTVSQVLPQGAIISVTDDVDGFMPRSKMKNVLRGNKIPYHPGDKIQVKVADLIPEDESLILAPAASEEEAQMQQMQAENNKPRRNQGAPQQGDKQPKPAQASSGQGVTLLDMLSDADKSKFFNLSEDEEA